MKTVFFGTPNYATASIRALLRSEIEVSMICTRPARGAGRGRVATPTPVAVFGDDLGIPVITPERLDRGATEEIHGVGADVFVVVAYGRFIPAELLSLPRLGVVNIHPSLLPKHRGPSPVATAILDGDRHTGVTIMLLDEGMDTGPILSQSQLIEIGPRERCDSLTERLFDVGTQLLPRALNELDSGELVPRRQDDSAATVTRLIRKSDGDIDWRLPADLIERMNRAYHPWPGTSTTWRGQPLKVLDVELTNDSLQRVGLEPGLVFERSDGVFVAAGVGSSLKLLSVQAAGRRAMSATDFAIGRADFVGSRLGAQLD